MIIIADTGPLLHLYWVGALDWALPPQPIAVAEAVWREVEKHDAHALADDRLQRVIVTQPPPTRLAEWLLDEGEEAALCYALTLPTGSDVLILCDEIKARKACNALALPVTGSVGLIIEAFREGRASHEAATAALRALPDQGRFHIKAELIARAVALIAGESQPPPGTDTEPAE